MIEQNVEKHYSDRSVDLEAKILHALKLSGKNLNKLVWTDLSGLDEFHLLKKEATEEMASLLNLQQDTWVLDAGCGLGGPSRHLAAKYGCRVTGIDLSRSFCDVAKAFAVRFGFENKLSYQQGSVLDLPYEDNSFDVVWTQHVSMNIENKQQFFSELYRVLKPGGFLACFDILSGSSEPIDFPVPWASSSEISFLASTEEQKQLITYPGFEIQSWVDQSQKALSWLEAIVEKAKQQKTPPLGYQLFLGERTGEMMSNQIKNFQSGRTRVVQIIARKGADIEIIE